MIGTMPAGAVPGLEQLPRITAVLRDVLGLAPCNAHLHLDLAEALACDPADRDELRRIWRARFARPAAAAELEACESIADLLRLLARIAAPPAWA
jgi:hypothetical protein